jgi:hypothetical protein
MMANGPMQCIVTPHSRSRPGHERDRSGEAKKRSPTNQQDDPLARTTRYSRPVPCHPTRGASGMALACEVGHGHTHTGRGGEVGLLRSLSRRATIQEKKWQKAWGTERWGAHGC